MKHSEKSNSYHCSTLYILVRHSPWWDHNNEESPVLNAAQTVSPSSFSFCAPGSNDQPRVQTWTMTIHESYQKAWIFVPTFLFWAAHEGKLPLNQDKHPAEPGSVSDPVCGGHGGLIIEEGVSFGNLRVTAQLFEAHMVLLVSSGHDHQLELGGLAADCEAAGKRASSSKCETVALKWMWVEFFHWVGTTGVFASGGGAQVGVSFTSDSGIEHSFHSVFLQLLLLLLPAVKLCEIAVTPAFFVFNRHKVQLVILDLEFLHLSFCSAFHFSFSSNLHL